MQNEPHFETTQKRRADMATTRDKTNIDIFDNVTLDRVFLK